MQKSKKSLVSRRRFLQIVGVAGVAGACWQMGLLGPGKPLQVAQRSMPIMGTVLNLTLYGPDRESCEAAIGTTVRTMQNLEKKLSRHLESSELSRLNQDGILVAPGVDLLNVLHLAADLNLRSDGAFDVTILPILRNLEDGKTVASGTNTQRIEPKIGFDKVTVSDKAILLLEEGMAISLDGVGKGYIVDKGVEELKKSGFTNVIVDAGGDIMVSGQKAGKTPWQIGIRNPRPGKFTKTVAFPVSNKAVATSGDYMQPFTEDFRQHHIIDPRIGSSPEEIASCTVTAPNVALADGLATAVMVLGKENGLELIESLEGCEAYLITKADKRPDNRFQDFSTTNFFS